MADVPLPSPSRSKDSRCSHESRTTSDSAPIDLSNPRVTTPLANSLVQHAANVLDGKRNDGKKDALGLLEEVIQGIRKIEEYGGPQMRIHLLLSYPEANRSSTNHDGSTLLCPVSSEVLIPAFDTRTRGSTIACQAFSDAFSICEQVSSGIENRLIFDRKPEISIPDWLPCSREDCGTETELYKESTEPELISCDDMDPCDFIS